MVVDLFRRAAHRLTVKMEGLVPSIHQPLPGYSYQRLGETGPQMSTMNDERGGVVTCRLMFVSGFPSSSLR